MWKNIASRISVCLANNININRRSMSRRSLLWHRHHCFQNTTSNLVIQNNLCFSWLLFSKNDSYSGHYYSLKSNQRRVRLMSNNSTCSSRSTKSDEGILVFAVEGIPEEKVGKALSLIHSDALITNTGNNNKNKNDIDNEVRDVLTNFKFYRRLEEDILQELKRRKKVTEDYMRQHRYLKYVEWLCYRDEFKVPQNHLPHFIYEFTAFMPSYNKFVLDALWNLVKRIGGPGPGGVVISEYILNRLLSFSSIREDSELAFEIFNKFPDFGCVPNFGSYYLTASSARNRDDLPWQSEFVHKIVDDGILDSCESCDDGWLYCLFHVYCLRYKKPPRLAHALYVALKHRGRRAIPVNIVYFLIHSLSQHDDTVCLAMDVASDLDLDRSRATRAYSSVIGGLCRKGDVDGATKLLMDMIAGQGHRNPPPGPGVNSAFTHVINAMCRADDLEGAFEMLKIMESRGLKPNVGTCYRPLFLGCQRRGLMHQACLVVFMAINKHPRDPYLIRLSNQLHTS